MTQINWGLATQPSSFENALTKGFQIGSAVKQQRQERETQSALAAYAANPDDPAAVQGVVKADPRMGIPLIEKQRERQREAELGKLTQAAMSDDPAIKGPAMQQLAVASFDRWKAIDKQQRDAATQQAKQYGNAALYALQSGNPRAQVQAYAQQTGDPKVAALLDLPDDQLNAALKKAVFDAEFADKLIELEQPEYRGFAADEDIVNVRDPQAVQAVAARRMGGAQPRQVKQIGDKSYFQDANGDWYEEDGAGNGSATFP